MTMNKTPVYEGKPLNKWGNTGTSANTAKDGTGTVVTVCQASTDGSLIRELRFKSTGTTGNATVARIFINNNTSNATPGNNSLYEEVTLPNITNSEVAAQQTIVVPCNLPLEPSFKLNVTIGTAVSAGWQVTAIGYDFAQV